MSDTIIGTPSKRTSEQVVREMDLLKAKLALLDLELKRLSNPNGPTLADLRGVWAALDIDDEPLDLTATDHTPDSRSPALNRVGG